MQFIAQLYGSKCIVFVYVDQLFGRMDEILSQKPVLKENYYAILGCDELSTVRLSFTSLSFGLFCVFVIVEVPLV